MARIYASRETWEKWIPDVDNERKIAKKKPDRALSVELKFLTKDEKNAYERMANAALAGGIDEKEQDCHMRELFRTHVRNIKNYVYDGIEITTGEQLYDCDEIDLIGAITSALSRRSRLEEGMAKNLCIRSDSLSSHQTESDRGDAQGATRASTQTTQEATTPLQICDSQTKKSAG
jgi:hypothetical protein